MRDGNGLISDGQIRGGGHGQVLARAIGRGEWCLSRLGAARGDLVCTCRTRLGNALLGLEIPAWHAGAGRGGVGEDSSGRRRVAEDGRKKERIADEGLGCGGREEGRQRALQDRVNNDTVPVHVLGACTEYSQHIGVQWYDALYGKAGRRVARERRAGPTVGLRWAKLGQLTSRTLPLLPLPFPTYILRTTLCALCLAYSLSSLHLRPHTAPPTLQRAPVLSCVHSLLLPIAPVFSRWPVLERTPRLFPPAH